MTRTILGWLALASLAIVTLPATHADAFCRMTTMGNGQSEDEVCNEVGAPLEWSRACLSYAIDVRGSQWMNRPDLEGAIDLAFEEWENVDCGSGEPPSVVFQPLEASTCQRAEYNCEGNVNTIAFLDPFGDPCGGRYQPEAFAVTIVWHNEDTGEIFDADMMINDQLASGTNAGGPYANCPDSGCPPAVGANPSVADLRSIVTHEIGHMIGIGHSNIEEATMFASNARRSVEKRDLHPDDEDAICSIYPPGNLAQSCDATPRGGLLLDCEQRACSSQACSSGSTSSGCSATNDPRHAPWGGILAALFGLIALRRRPTLDARS